MKSVVGSLLLTLALAAPAHAGLVAVTPSAFGSGTAVIGFSERPAGTPLTTYTPADYGGQASDPLVSFGGLFAGQSLGMSAACGGGAYLCANGLPSGVLAIAASAPGTVVTPDSAQAGNLVLSSTLTMLGPISILFSRDLSEVGVDAGWFDAVGATAMRAYARDGSLLGTVSNRGAGVEFMGLATDDGRARIAGIQFSTTGYEPAGFSVDNLRFVAGAAPQQVDEPAPLALIGLAAAAALGSACAKRRRGRATAQSS